MTKQTVSGAKFRPQSFFRPTQMSVAMADAGVIPGTHLVGQLAATAVLRDRNDMTNQRRSSLHVY